MRWSIRGGLDIIVQYIHLGFSYGLMIDMNKV